MKRSKLYSILNTLVFVAIFSPSVQVLAKPQAGGIGTGSGNRIMSDPQEIKQTILGIWEELKSDRLSNPLSMAGTVSDLDPKLRDIFSRMAFPFLKYSVEEIVSRRERGEKVYIHPKDYLEESSLYFLENSFCEGKNHNKSEASVSDFKFGAKVCFSLMALSETPRGTTHQTLLALIVHEIAHLNGYDEDVAQKIQKIFIDNYSRVMRLDNSFRLYRLVTLTMTVESALQNASFGGAFTLGFAAGTISAIVDMLPNTTSPSDDNVKVAHPEMYKQLIDRLDNCSNEINGLAAVLNSSDAEVVNKRLTQVQAHFREAQDMLQIYLLGKINIERSKEKN